MVKMHATTSATFRRRESEPAAIRPKSMHCNSRRDSLPISNFKMQDLVRQDQEKSKLVERMSTDLGVSRSAERNLIKEVQELKDAEATMRSNIEVMTERISTQKEIIIKSESLWSNLPGTVKNLKILFNETKRMRLDREICEAKEENLSDIIADLAENNYKRLEEMAFLKLSMTGKLVDKGRSRSDEIHDLQNRIQELLLTEGAKNKKIEKIENRVANLTDSLQEQLVAVRELREGKEALDATVLNLNQRIEHLNKIIASYTTAPIVRGRSPVNNEKPMKFGKGIPPANALPVSVSSRIPNKVLSPPACRTVKKVSYCTLPPQIHGYSVAMDIPHTVSEESHHPSESEDVTSVMEATILDIELVSKVIPQGTEGVSEIPHSDSLQSDSLQSDSLQSDSLESELKSNASECSVAATDEVYPLCETEDNTQVRVMTDNTSVDVDVNVDIDNDKIESFGKIEIELKILKNKEKGKEKGKDKVKCCNQMDDVCSITSTSSLTAGSNEIHSFNFI